MEIWSSIDTHISASLGQNFRCLHRQNIGGGCISTAWRIGGDYNAFFVKLNSTKCIDMFAAEFDGLQLLRQTETVKVPKPICFSSTHQQSFLVTEYLDFNTAVPNSTFAQQLAALHKHSSDNYGWHRNNTIGATPQINTPGNNWVDFWCDNRLGFQLKLADKKGYRGQLQEYGSQLLEGLYHFFAHYTPEASLLHGDLWSGNVSASHHLPVIYDPAVYYGDREADIAMTELFGGFNASFYSSYNDCWPLDSDYKIRKHLYNLYHLLNHLNLFGKSYHQQCIHSMQKLLSEIK